MEIKLLIWNLVNLDSSTCYWQQCYRCPPPIINLTIVLLHIIIHAVNSNSLSSLLEFQPSQKGETWRYFTYSLIHVNWSHVLSNSSVQLLFGNSMELLHGPKIVVIYIIGVIAGSLLHAVLNNATLTGASAGISALVIAWIPDKILNYNDYKHPILWLILVVLFIIWESLMARGMTSLEAHYSGGIVGLLFGFVLLKTAKKSDLTRWLLTIPFFLGVFYLGFLINLNITDVHTY